MNFTTGDRKQVMETLHLLAHRISSMEGGVVLQADTTDYHATHSWGTDLVSRQLEVRIVLEEDVGLVRSHPGER